MTKPPKKAKFIWGGGVLAIAAYFLVFEIPAINAPGETFSEFVWYLLEFHPVMYGVIGGPLVLLALWLPGHFLGKGKWGPAERITALLKSLVTRGK